MTIFAVSYILKGGLFCLLVAGFFYASTAICGSEPPCKPVIGLLPLRCMTTGQAEPFFFAYKQNLSVMSYTETFCLDGEITPKSSTLNRAKSISSTAHNRVKNQNPKTAKKEKAVENFGNSKSIATFVEPNSSVFTDPAKILDSAISGLPTSNSTSVDLSCLATEGGPRFLCPHQVIASAMPNSCKNLNTDVQGTPVSTPNGAKSVSLVAHTRLKSHNLKLQETVSNMEAVIAANGLKRLFTQPPSKGNLYTYLLDKILTQFMQEELRGYPLADFRLQRKLEALRTLETVVK